MDKRLSKLSYFLISGLALFLAFGFFSFCAAQNSASSADASNNSDQSVSKLLYYLIPVVWDMEKNTLKMKEDAKITLTADNLIKDAGSGSQFYARVINFNDKSEVFPNKQTKLFLGKWQAEKNEKQKEISLSIPAYRDGMKVMIFDAKSRKTIFSNDVSDIFKFESAKMAVPPPEKIAVGSTTGVSHQKYAITGIVLAVFLSIVAGIVIFFRRRKTD